MFNSKLYILLLNEIIYIKYIFINNIYFINYIYIISKNFLKNYKSIICSGNSRVITHG